jgi:hypothetical protein
MTGISHNLESDIFFIDNYTNFEEPDLLIFNHLPKCGGTSLHHMLNTMFGDEESFTVQVSDDGALNTDDFDFLYKKRNIKLFKGHLHTYKPESVLHSRQSYLYFTFLRDPIERSISYYTYCKKTPINKFYKEINDENLSLIDFFNRHGAKHIDIFNGQAKLIAAQEKSENLLKNAVNAIKDKYFFIGFTEYYAESVCLLNSKLKIDFSSYNHSNASGSKTSNYTSEELEYLRKKNAIDIELYNLMLNEFKKLINLNSQVTQQRMEQLKVVIARKKRGEQWNRFKHFVKSNLYRS